MKRRGLLLAPVAVLGIGAGGAWWTRRWRYIVVHHSAGTYGDIAMLQRVHRERQPGDPIDAIPYHYVIGNGRGLGVGEVASDWRRSLHIWGAHVSARNRARNLFGIGVCVIGNLEEHEMPARQLEALVALTRALMTRYDIPPQNVTGHGLLEGESTRCPGRNFPLREFRAGIA